MGLCLAPDAQEHDVGCRQVRGVRTQGRQSAHCSTVYLIIVQYADLSEYGYGVAILSESKYGFSCRGNVLRISLLRAATAPDSEQDQGMFS